MITICYLYIHERITIQRYTFIILFIQRGNWHWIHKLNITLLWSGQFQQYFTFQSIPSLPILAVFNSYSFYFNPKSFYIGTLFMYVYMCKDPFICFYLTLCCCSFLFASLLIATIWIEYEMNTSMITCEYSEMSKMWCVNVSNSWIHCCFCQLNSQHPAMQALPSKHYRVSLSEKLPALKSSYRHSNHIHSYLLLNRML